MKKITELKKIKGDAYEYYLSSDSETDLFNKIFITDALIDEIKKPDKYFLIGEKGSGKTAYSVYLSNGNQADTYATIKMVENTVYQKFLNMKRNKSLELSSYKDIWINIIYLIIAESIKDQLQGKILSYIKYSNLTKSIEKFYSDAFKPEFINALEFVDNSTTSINTMAKFHLFNTSSKIGQNSSAKYIEQNYQISLMKIRDVFEKALNEIELKKKFILFIDGIDARPDGIDHDQYIDCLKGLVNASLEINKFFRTQNIKVMLSIRPDIIYKMSIHNMNQKIRDNSILLNWKTSYKDYKYSKLFKIADNFFSKQQEQEHPLGYNWSYYMPFKAFNRKQSRYIDDSFIDFLRYSLYKPRDILTMLNEMCLIPNCKDQFTAENFKQILTNYSQYLLGELKDYMLIYLSDEEYTNFNLFFSFLYDKPTFDYSYFKNAHSNYVNMLSTANKIIPRYMSTPDETLQFLFDSNIISYMEMINLDNGSKYPKMFWSFKERSYANIQPEVKKGAIYRIHQGYARSFKIMPINRY